MTVLIAEADADGTRGLDELGRGRNLLETMDRLGDRDIQHLVVLVADHGAELLLARKLHGLHAEPDAEDTVERGRIPSALQVTKHADRVSLPVRASISWPIISPTPPSLHSPLADCFRNC